MLNNLIEPIKAAQLVEHLLQGHLVAFPTETVYGLGGDAENPFAVANIYKAKGRPLNHPVIVHVHKHAPLERWAKNIPFLAQKLIEAFWPGPLTLILKCADTVLPAITGGQTTIGLRCPAHPLAQALLELFKQGQGGLAAPSANRFGRISPTTAAHVYEEFPELSDQQLRILDGGPCRLGIESTILDLSRDRPTILRPGSISPSQLAEIIGAMPDLPEIKNPLHQHNQPAPRVSGDLKSHYAPKTPLFLCTIEELKAQFDLLHASQKRIAIIGRQAFLDILETKNKAVELALLPEETTAIAHLFYGLLRQFDSKALDAIFFEKLPETQEFSALNDRLNRAAAKFST